MTTFGDIRSIVHSSPSRRCWEELCEALDDYAGDEGFEEVVVPYCHEMLERWPTPPRGVTRAAPERWARALIEGRDGARLSLCNSLMLQSVSIDPDGAERLAHTPHTASLVELRLFGNDLGDEGVRALAAAARFEELRRLTLAGQHIGDAGIEALASSSLLEGLEGLNLGGNDIGPRGMRALVDSAAIASLDTLNVSNNRLGPEGAEVLAGAEHLGSLGLLYAGGNDFGSRGARALADSPHLPEPIRAQWRR